MVPILCTSFFFSLFPRCGHQARGRSCLSGQLPPGKRASVCTAHEAPRYGSAILVFAASPGHDLPPPPAGRCLIAGCCDVLLSRPRHRPLLGLGSKSSYCLTGHIPCVPNSVAPGCNF
ncbi:hypothetical protein NDU88_009241 [Pleurodeles waltl]|uniref:Secreted protein n=1 Tax=Pleurodeles waltl TaxID=8319 RepID=A0AAV7RVN0_PLEWA|nr:hypothetical protein NDU88_009241 [Pleurodeles waltl]